VPIGPDCDNMAATPDSPRPFRHRLLLWVAGVGPIGLAPASGTVAVGVVGIPLFLLMHRLPLAWYIGTTLLLTGLAIVLHDLGDRILGEKDSRRLVLDELVGYAVAMTAVPATWQLIALGFLIERALDIAKFPPADIVERRLPGGWGVVGDDVIAGLYTLGVLHALAWLAPGVMGVF